MKAKQFKALQKCCASERSSQFRLSRIMINNGTIYATDSYIVARVCAPEYEGITGVIDPVAVAGWKAAQNVSPEELKRFIIDEPLPIMPERMDDFLKQRDPEGLSVGFNPEFLKKALDVFKAFGACAQMVNPLDTWIQLFTGLDCGYEIAVAVAGKRC